MRTALSNQKAKDTQGLVVVISGPSGVGKTTLARKLLDDPVIGRRLVKSISFTTRPRRTGERTGRDYFFITEADFKEKLKAKKILEWTKYLGYYYATSKEFVDKHLKRGRSLVLCLDFKGARKIKRFYPRQSITIFVAPPSIDELRKRITARCLKTSREEIERRLQAAAEELQNASAYDYRVLNNDIATAVRRLITIIGNEEKQRIG